MKKHSSHTDLHAIIDAIDINGQGNIAYAGHPYTGQEFREAATEVRLFHQLANLLYAACYTRSGWQKPETLTIDETVHDFRRQLRAANQSREGYDGGWNVEEVEQTGNILVRKGGSKRYTYAGECIRERFGQGPLRPGESVRIHRFSEQGDEDDPDAGFYHVFGDYLLDNNSESIVRFYFHLKPEGAAPLIAFVSGTLNRYQIPFQFKCLNHPASYRRADAGVLYIDKRYFQIALELIQEAYNALKTYLKPETPLFTRSVLPGIAMAENPFNPAESFGTSRCSIVAQGIVQAWKEQLPKSEWAACILNGIEKNFFTLENFHLNPNSKYPYSLSSAENQTP